MTKHNGRTWWAMKSVILAVCAAPGVAAAQEPQADTSGEIIVTARRQSEALRETPVSVSVLDAQALASRGQVLLRDYAAAVPGLNVTPNYVGFQNVTIRGITTGSDAPTTAITIDDIQFGGAFTNGVPDIDPGDLERIEVLRGPQGTNYGANGLGGLVRYITQRPSTGESSGRIDVGVNTIEHGDQGYVVRASGNLALSDAAALRMSAFARRDAGYIDNPRYGLDDVNSADAQGVRAALRLNLGPQTTLDLSALYQRSETNALHEAVVDPAIAALEQNYLGGTGTDERTIEGYSATLSTEIAGLDLVSVTGYNVNHDITTLDYSFGFGGAVQAEFGVDGAAFYYNLRNERFSQEVRLSGGLGDQIEWLLGGYFSAQEESRPRETRIDGVDSTTLAVAGKYFGLTAGSALDEYATFANLQWARTERFDLRLGVRANRYELDVDPDVFTGPFAADVLGSNPSISLPRSASAQATTYDLTARYRLTPGVMAYGRFATGFRPGVANLSAPGIPGASTPDTTESYELGLKGEFLGGLLYGEITLYDVVWNDIQLQLRDPINLIPYQSNGGQAQSRGVEIYTVLRPTDALEISFNGGFGEAELTEAFPVTSDVLGARGARLPYNSDVMASLAARYEFPLASGLVWLRGQTTYVGDRQGVFTPSGQRQDLDAYTQTNVELGYEADGWRASLFVNNLSDERGLLSGGIGYFQPAARIFTTPRMLGLTLTRTF